MAHSIEACPPFLDHVLNEYINQLPPSIKLRFTDNITPPNDQKRNPASTKLIEKWILHKAAKDFISPEVYKQKKQPYLCPIQWPHDGPLHQMLRHLCSQEAVENLGFMSWEVVKQVLQSGFGVSADQGLFQLLLAVGAWIVLSRCFDVKKATEADWPDVCPYDPWQVFGSSATDKH